MSVVNKSEIRKIGREVRSDIPEPLGYCYPASKKIVRKLKNKYGLTDSQVFIKEVRVGKSGTIKHYVVQLKAKCVKDTDYRGSLLIDVTLDQYCDENLCENRNEGGVRISFGSQSKINKINIYEFGKAPYSNT